MKLKSETTSYMFECLERSTVKKCIEKGGSAGLRDLIESLRNDTEVLAQLADAIDAGDAYNFSHERIRTWQGWG